MTNPIQIPVLQTGRLVLEPLSMKHSLGMFNLWSDPTVCKFSGIVRDYYKNRIPTPVTTRHDSNRIIDFWLRASVDGWGFRWAVVLTNRRRNFVGTIGFNSISECAEIAYHLLPQHWGAGIMTEASHAAIEWSRLHGATHIEAYIESENKASIRLAQQLGMEATSTFSEGSQRYAMSL